MALIYQPEVAANAIVFAADHPERREYWIGTASLKAILGNRIAPGLLDRIMAKRTWSGQFTAERISLTRSDNLFAPVEELHATYGIFGERSETFSLQASLGRHKWAVAGGAAGLAAAFVAGFLGERSGPATDSMLAGAAGLPRHPFRCGFIIRFTMRRDR